MTKMATASINVSKIDKSKLFKGEKGTYLDVVIWFNEEPDQYGNDFSIQQSVSKEDRGAGVKGAYLGNGKYPGKVQNVEVEEQEEGGDDDGLPW